MAKTMADEKAYLRAILRESREALPAARVAALSAAIQARLLATEFYASARGVVLYAAAGNEVATDLILADALRAGREVYYPRVADDRRTIRLASITDRRELEPGAFGILEPPADRAGIAPADLPSGTLVCVPGLAFSLTAARIGRGGGHYDRFLAQIPAEARTVGLAYSFQVLDRLPETQTDRRVKFVVTEFAVHRAASHASTSRIDRGGTSTCQSC
jgi:5-formyltetrahydrofolate cyclo-ligase